MSTTPPTALKTPSRSWIWQVTILSVILGVLLALSLQTQHTFAEKGLPPRYSTLATRYFELESVNKDSEKEIVSLRDNVTKLENDLKSSVKNGTGKTQVLALSKQLQDIKLFAGLTPVEGPGVEVVLSDSVKGPELAKQLAGGQDQGQEYQNQLSNFLVHDQDIVGVVNELKQAGAEAISVNGQRIVSTSSIRCVGPIVLINHKPAGGAAPYTITAIGSPRDLEDGLKLPGGYLDTQQLLAYNMVTIHRKDKVRVPEFVGGTQFDYAKPAVVPAKSAKTLKAEDGTTETGDAEPTGAADLPSDSSVSDLKPHFDRPSDAIPAVGGR
jgi:uncharacterized protein YlxW (UPF0749 family)